MKNKSRFTTVTYMIIPKRTHRDPSILKLSMLFIAFLQFFLALGIIRKYLVKEIKFNNTS